MTGSAPLALRAMTFNVLAEAYGNLIPHENPQAWTRRVDLNVDTIRKANPDVLGVQEMGMEHLRVYQQTLPEYNYWLGVTANPCIYPITPMRNYYNGWWPAIFWKADRFDLVEAGGFYISRSADEKEWWVSDTFNPRYMHPINWVQLRAKENGQEFLCFNTHMHHLARTEGNRPFVGEMLRRSRGHLPVILTGDFNNHPWTAEWPDTAHRAFREGGFIDTYLAAGCPETPEHYSYHAYLGRNIPPGEVEDPWRMDWVMVHPGAAKLTVQGAEIITTEQLPLYPSDHYPVVGDFTLA
jgi:hypothetical protein